MKVKPKEKGTGYVPAKKEDYGPYDVECPSCGAMDNHAALRRGLCIWCASALALEVGEREFAAIPSSRLAGRARSARNRAALRGQTPKIIARRQGWKTK